MVYNDVRSRKTFYGDDILNKETFGFLYRYRAIGELVAPCYTGGNYLYYCSQRPALTRFALYFFI